MLGGVGAAVAATVSADSPESPGVFQNRCFCSEGRHFWLGTALSRDVFLTFVGQPRTNRLLLGPVSDHGRPTIASKAGVSREASQKSQKNVARKTLRRSRSMFFGFFSDSIVRKTYF